MIATDRLILRRWVDADRPAFYAQSGDPLVMTYLGGVQTRAQVDATLDRHAGYFDSHGLGFWAVERRGDGVALGFCGLKPGAPDTPIADALEIGWRFGSNHWGKGYAYEAARATLDWARVNRADDVVWSITAAQNLPSTRLMEKLGMKRCYALDFVHPASAPGSRFAAHVTYSILRPF